MAKKRTKGKASRKVARKKIAKPSAKRRTASAAKKPRSSTPKTSSSKSAAASAVDSTAAMNLLRGRASDRGPAGTEITAGELRFTRAGVPDGEVIVGIRPESLDPVPADAAGPVLDLDVDLVEPLGEQALVHGTVAATAARSGAEEEQAILTDASSRAPVTAVFPAAGLPAPGDRVRVRAAEERIYLFSAATGESIW